MILVKYVYVGLRLSIGFLNLISLDSEVKRIQNYFDWGIL